jgi:predicted lipoprotein with Yx(FWY)xxD motif
MPPGFQVIANELEGPVFADAKGHTLYTWPIKAMRNGYAGDPQGKSVCGDKVTLKSAGLMSPYPGGLDLPEPNNHVSCIAYWPPVYAGDDAKPVGKWSIITREDGKKQWAYDDHALYTSVLDHAPGDVLGGTGIDDRGDSPAAREPVGPPPAVPPGFRVKTTLRGRMLLTDGHYSVYESDGDSPNKSNCVDACARIWLPILAPASAQPQGDWSIIERAPAVRQWVFRKKPLYTYSGDEAPGSVDGNDVSGWHSVYTQVVPSAPKDFTIQTNLNGKVLADSHGKTVYYYSCGEDSVDQLACDTMESPQEYRLAVCGDGDVAKCLQTWPYVVASPSAKSESRLWSAVWVDPKTGHRAQPNQQGALRVWAYRDRPVYTYAGDHEPGDFQGNNAGEWHGKWNGYQAFWIRDLGARN